MPNETHLHADHAAETHPSPAELGPGYEVRDARVGGIVLFAAGLVVALALTQVTMWGLLKAFSGGKPEPNPTGTAPLQADRQREILLRNEDAVLNGYDRGKDGKSAAVRIPVDRALDLIAERGLTAKAKGGRPRTEVEINSHSGETAPARPDEKGSKK